MFYLEAENPKFKTVTDCMYCIIMTITGVGYGTYGSLLAVSF